MLHESFIPKHTQEAQQTPDIQLRHVRTPSCEQQATHSTFTSPKQGKGLWVGERCNPSLPTHCFKFSLKHYWPKSCTAGSSSSSKYVSWEIRIFKGVKDFKSPPILLCVRQKERNWRENQWVTRLDFVWSPITVSCHSSEWQREGQPCRTSDFCEMDKLKVKLEKNWSIKKNKRWGSISKETPSANCTLHKSKHANIHIQTDK